MKYAREVQELLGPMPGREFRMVQIVRYVANGRRMDRKERHAMKVAIWRVLQELERCGVISVRPPVAKIGGPAWYAWKVSHALVAEHH